MSALLFLLVAMLITHSKVVLKRYVLALYIVKCVHKIESSLVTLQLFRCQNRLIFCFNKIRNIVTVLIKTKVWTLL